MADSFLLFFFKLTAYELGYRSINIRYCLINFSIAELSECQMGDIR